MDPSSIVFRISRYNRAGRLTGTIAPDPDGAGPLRYLATRNTYDSNGRLAKTEFGELGAWLNETVPPSAWSSHTTYTVFSSKEFTYDAYGRKTGQLVRGSDGVAEASTEYSSSSTSLLTLGYGADGKRANLVRPGGTTTIYTRDNVGRLEQDALGHGPCEFAGQRRSRLSHRIWAP
jgi:hypothetical protein